MQHPSTNTQGCCIHSGCITEEWSPVADQVGDEVALLLLVLQSSILKSKWTNGRSRNLEQRCISWTNNRDQPLWGCADLASHALIDAYFLSNPNLGRHQHPKARGLSLWCTFGKLTGDILDGRRATNRDALMPGVPVVPGVREKQQPAQKAISANELGSDRIELVGSDGEGLSL